MKKRILSIFVTVCMLLTMLPTAAFATEGTGEGTDTQPPEVTTYTVSFDANGGKGTMTAEIATQGVAYTLPACSFTKPYYQFMGWSKSADGEVITEETIEVTADTTLYAIWKEQYAKDGVKTTLWINGPTIVIGDGTLECAEGAGYPDPDGYIITGSGSAKANRVIVTGGNHNITFKDLNIDYPNSYDYINDPLFNVQEGNVNLTLEGTNYLSSKSNPEISVGSNASLTITAESTGSLETDGISGGGTIIINGGKINANWLGNAVINGGWFADGNVTNNTIYGIAVAEGKYVVDMGENEPYRYLISDGNSTMCTVSFYANNGEETMDSLQIPKGSYTLPESCTFTAPAGKVFTGWAYSADGTLIAERTISVLTETISLYAVWEDASVAGIEIDASHFPDEAFRNYIKNNWDTNHDLHLSDAEIANATEMAMEYQEITSLTGIEYFSSLEKLDCSYNQLTELDVSRNTELTCLWCDHNNLRFLDVSGNTKLTEIICYGNALTSLNLSNTNISSADDVKTASLTSDANVDYTIIINNGRTFDLSTLPGFDVSKVKTINGGTISGNILTVGLDVLKVTYDYDCGRDVVKTFTLTISNPVISGVTINAENFPDDNFRNKVSGYDTNGDGILSTSEAAAVNEIIIYASGSNPYGSLKGIEYFTELTSLTCEDTDITSLDLSENTKLIELILVRNVSMVTLDVSGAKELENLKVYGPMSSGTNGQLILLDLSNNTKLKTLWCNNNSLTSLDLSNHHSLADFYCNPAGYGENKYPIPIDSNRKFDLSTLPGNFDVSKASNWTGGTVSGKILTVNSGATQVTYNYNFGKTDAGNGTFILEVANACTISFNANTGGGLMDNVSVAQNGNYILPECEFTAPDGKQFKGWATAADGEVIAGTTITVSASTTLYAIWEDIPVVTKYQVTVTDGTGGGEYAEDETVTVTANAAPEGQQFTGWQVVSGGVTLADATQSTTSFTMPADAVEIKAVYKTVPTIAFASGYDPSKTYDGVALSNPTAEQLTLTNAEYGDVTFTWTNGTDPTPMASNPVNKGIYHLTASIAETDNRAAASVTLERIVIYSASVFPEGTNLTLAYDISTLGMSTSFELPALPENLVAVGVAYNLKSNGYIGDDRNNEFSIYNVFGTDRIEGNTLSFDIGGDIEANTYTLTVEAKDSFSNYYETVTLKLTAKDAVKVTVAQAPVNSNPTYNGQPQALVTAGTLQYPDVSVLKYSLDGTNWSTDIPTATNAGEYTVYYKAFYSTNFVGNTGEYYTDGDSVEMTATIAPAPLTVKADDKSIYVGGTPAYTCTVEGLKGSDTFTDPTIAAADADVNTVGSYTITISGGTYNSNNYTITYVNGTLTVSKRSSGGSSGTSSSTTTTTEKNDDGSTTTTTTNKVTGTVTETTKNPDGSTETVETKKDGTVTTTVKDADGSTTKTVETPDGTVEAEATVSNKAGNEIVADAKENGASQVVIAPEIPSDATKTEVSIPASTVGNIGSQTDADLTVSTPVADVSIPNGGLADLAHEGGQVTVTAEKSGNTVELTVTAGRETVTDLPGGITLTVPVEDAAPGTVAVLVKEDGSREVIRKSVSDDGTVSIPLSGSATVELIDNSKDFTDTKGHWASKAIDFVTARGLYAGTSVTTFTPNGSMTRAMLARVLHNLESNPGHAFEGTFHDLDGHWATDSIHWAADRGIVAGYPDGSYGADDSITREQLAVMLWRYAGSPETDHGLGHFKDAGSISSYAQIAMAWANENGIIGGIGNNTLDPKGNATRAQVATMLMRMMQQM